MAATIITAPAMVAPRLMRCDLSPAHRPQHLQRRARGWRCRAGSRPASSVTPTPSTIEVMTSEGWMTGAPSLTFRNCCEMDCHPTHDDVAQQVAQREADGRADDALHQPLGQDQADDRAAARADRPQHADVVPALGDDGAEGVEDDEPAHEQRQEAEHVEHGLSAMPRLANSSEPLVSAFRL